MRYGADPLEQLIRKEGRNRVVTGIKDGKLVVTFFLPLDDLLPFVEEIEKGKTLSHKLRIMADKLDSMD